MNNYFWDGWKDYFENQGFICYVLVYLKYEGNLIELRINLLEGLEDVEFEDWIMNLEILIDSLFEKFILIGYLFGGFIVQKLVELGRVVVVILISSVLLKGNVVFDLNFFKVNNLVISLLKGNFFFNFVVEKYKKWFYFVIVNIFSKVEFDVLFE